MDAPLNPQPTVGRIFGSDWTIANVAKLLRFNAGQDFLRADPLIGGLREISENYLRRTSARHLPSSITVTFRRDTTAALSFLCAVRRQLRRPRRPSPTS
jgi:hypothetical protein